MVYLLEYGRKDEKITLLSYLIITIGSNYYNLEKKSKIKHPLPLSLLNYFVLYEMQIVENNVLNPTSRVVYTCTLCVFY